MKRLNLALRNEIIDLLEKLAEHYGLSRTAVIVLLVKEKARELELIE